MNQPNAHHNEPHPEVGHVAPMWILVAIWLGLMFLTYITVAVAQFDFGDLNIVIAMGIATVKAALVIMFFMHLVWDKPFNAFILISTLVFVFLFILFALLDTGHYINQVIPGYYEPDQVLPSLREQ